MRPTKLPAVSVTPQPVVWDGGLDLISAPGYAKPGTARFASNYELEFGGGYRRIGGFERFDGRPAPSDATYVMLEASAGFSATLALGDVVTGQTSAAGMTIVWISTDLKRIAGTKKTGAAAFTTEVILLGPTPVGTVTETDLIIDGFVDNEVSELAANEYRADIFEPSGTGPVRGVAILDNAVYCWRDVAGALVIYKATAAGWTPVPLFSQVSFTAGSDVFEEGGTVTQGANTAIVKRCVLESGSWSGGTAAGRLIIEPTAGVLAAGVAGGSGIATLSGAPTQISLFGGGRVSTVVHNFTGAISNRRLYGCDGTNLEFEFDGTVLVPLNTGMAGLRAKHVFVFKNHLFFAYDGSLQHSGVGDPYKWTPLFGAGELTTGDIITNLRGVPASETNAALMAICQDSAWVLYGNSSADWDFKKISDEAGAKPYSAMEMGGVIAYDRDGFRIFKPTDTFGNFDHESASKTIEPLAANATPRASVLVKNKSRYRCFFADGMVLSGTPIKGGIGWMPCDYGVVINCAIGGEIDGQYRIFMGADNGFVYEADRGRSFDGGVVQAGLRLSSLNQGKNVVEKQYRHVELECQAESAFELAVAAEFSDSDPEQAVVETTSMQNARQMYGSGLFWDFEAWDRAYWDVAMANRTRYPLHGKGRSVSLLIASEAVDELPHTIKSGTVLFTPRRLAR